jgi:hypothetical protein
MAHTPVIVARYTSVAEADFARMVLLGQGIAATVANAAVVSWFWHYSLAIGGAQVLVRHADAESAWAVLYPPDEGGDTANGPAACAVCSESLHPGWQTCWQCGATVGEETGELPSDEQFGSPPGHSAGDVVKMVGVGVLVLATLSIWSPTWLAAVLLAVVVFCGCHYLGRFWPDRFDPGPGVPHHDDSAEFGAGIAEDIAARAWRASVFGVVWFPPLIYYSMYLLHRLGRSGAPLTRRACARRNWARRINIVFFVPYTVLIVLIPVAMYFAHAESLLTLVSLAREALTGSDRPW